MKETTIEEEVDEPSTEEERANFDTIQCQGYCDREIFKSATVDVVAGEQIGTWDSPQRHVGITGVDVDHPEIEQWCVKCAEDEFDITKPAGERSIERTNKYLTPSNLISFVSGICTGLLLLSIVVV